MVIKENSLTHIVYHVSGNSYEDANRKIAITARNYMKPGNFNMCRFKKLKLRSTNSYYMHISNTNYEQAIIIIDQSKVRIVNMYINKYNNILFKYIYIGCDNLIDAVNNYELTVGCVFLSRYPKLYIEMHIRINYSSFII